jgi:WD40 repeat protein
MRVHAGKGWLAAGGQGLIIVWSLHDFSKVATFDAHDDVSGLVVLNFLQPLMMAICHPNTQKIHDIAFSPDGRRIVTCGQDRLLKVRCCSC